MAENQQPKTESNPELEGEGSHTADEAYRSGVARHIRQGRVEEEAEQARRAVEEDPEGLRRAEEEAKRRSAGDLPADEERI